MAAALPRRSSERTQPVTPGRCRFRSGADRLAGLLQPPGRCASDRAAQRTDGSRPAATAPPCAQAVASGARMAVPWIAMGR